MISISYGAQFRDGKAAWLFVLFVLIAAISVASFIQGAPLTGLILAVSSILLIIYVLDIRGVEINLEKKLYRIYSITAIGKRGKWQPYKDFKKISIKYDSFKINTASFGSSGVRTIAENHSRFVIELEHDSDKEKILFIREEQKYHDAVNYASKLSKTLLLPVRDHFGERLTEK